MQRQTYTARLLKKACISESSQCYHLEFAIDELERFDFLSGQFVSAVAVDPRGKSQTRAYSIASAPQENRFDLCVNRVEGGFFSNHLCDLTEGEAVQVHGPHGHFTLKSPVSDSIFVATGTGIAPMRGFTQWLFPETGPDAGADRSEGREIWLIYGTRHESEIYYRDYFERLAQERPNFHYITTLSRAHDAWEGHRGYVQEHLEAMAAKRGGPIETVQKMDHVGAAEGSLRETVVAVEERVIAERVAAEPLAFDIHTYICGLNNMVAAVRDRLKEYGWHRKQIIFERYD
ncbi:MAG TPA: FAD-dependent oxidoreductase [Acidobacteriaceae bacterium]